MSNGNLTSSDQKTANTLNKYFASVLTKENENNIPEFEHRNFNKILDEISITEKQVEEAINNLKPSNSQSHKFHPYFIKHTKECLKPLSIIFQKSLQESKLLEIWKRANITAILKEGDKNCQKIIDQ